ncbi:MAG: hypothetical protein K8F91_20380 [Candidatus Obscuribacterales bacterium]|nr:hypothetical protein [Candidatus Obscuribacterales bacterium]
MALPTPLQLVFSQRAGNRPLKFEQFFVSKTSLPDKQLGATSRLPQFLEMFFRYCALGKLDSFKDIQFCRLINSALINMHLLENQSPYTCFNKPFDSDNFFCLTLYAGAKLQSLRIRNCLIGLFEFAAIRA